MSNAVRASVTRPATRDRILAACRDLFNARGPAKVTTAEIAASVGIAEGNLHYHFPRKEQIVEALFEGFAEATRTVAVSYVADTSVGRYADYLSAWFNLMWEWRFFYRDGTTVFQIAPALRPRLRALAADGQTHVRGALEAMVGEGLLAAGHTEIDALVVNIWIVSAYWIDYLRTIRGVETLDRRHIQWGASQLQSLFAPYLTAAARGRLEVRVAASVEGPRAARQN